MKIPSPRPGLRALISVIPGLTLGALSTTAQEPAPNPAADIHPITPLGSRPDWSSLESFAKTLSREQFETEIRDVYLEKNRFPVPWVATSTSVKIQTGQSTRASVEIPFHHQHEAPAAPPRFWRPATQLPPLQQRPVLSDLHIAIDPGHIGGGYGRMEERHLSFQPGEAIQEGDLTLLTARILEQRLKAHGARITLVRSSSQPVTAERPEDFTNLARETLRQGGLDDPPETYGSQPGVSPSLTVQWQQEKFFYRIAEIHARARRVNHEIRPDLVLCLHFNAEAWGDSTAPQFVPVNHLHLLINGCYSPAELAHQDTRFEMLQRVFTGIHREEKQLAEVLAPALAASTGLPPYTYTTPNARPVGGSGYVYARNLLANRLYQCPVLFFEPYVMNHEQTYKRLLRGHWIGRTLIDDQLLSSAIEDYVQGIVSGLLSYYQTQRPS